MNENRHAQLVLLAQARKYEIIFTTLNINLTFTVLKAFFSCLDLFEQLNAE